MLATTVYESETCVGATDVYSIAMQFRVKFLSKFFDDISQGVMLSVDFKLVLWDSTITIAMKSSI